MDIRLGYFVWDERKDAGNRLKHGVSFEAACRAFLDPHAKFFVDSRHSQGEERLFCIARLDDKVITVRFTLREGEIRIIGAGYWRKGRKYYEA